jgi:hypothetical protein
VTTTSIIKITEEINIRSISPENAVDSADNEEQVTITRKQDIHFEETTNPVDNQYSVTKTLINTVVKTNDDNQYVEGNY